MDGSLNGSPCSESILFFGINLYFSKSFFEKHFNFRTLHWPVVIEYMFIAVSEKENDFGYFHLLWENTRLNG